MTIVITVLVILIIAIAVQVLKIAELKAKSKGKNVFEVTEKESKAQALLFPIFLIAYFGFFVWQIFKWGHTLLPVSASEHGVGYDNLMTVTLSIITFVFVVTHIILIWFSYKYSYSSKRKAAYYTHSNKLELIWTIIPSLALTVLILYGLTNWNSIMKPVNPEEEHVLVELYAKQFDWTARYAGEDGKLGRANIRLIEGVNALGLDSTDTKAHDDKIVKGEFHIPVDVPVQFVFRAQDVMHSAYMPHFRAQMNCVPGLKTQFNFKPTITTAEMREITGNDEFEYILLCNKICGAAHYNMQMKIVVDTPEDYNKWLAEQKQFIN